MVTICKKYISKLRIYINKKRSAIADKVTAQDLEVVEGNLTKDKEKVFGELSLCPNNTCSASLKENIIKKLEKNTQNNCPYCTTKLKLDEIKKITFNFEKI